MIERYKAIEVLLSQLREEDFLLSTTGMISREVFAIKDRPGNFYMIGSMGLLSSTGLGLALLCPSQRIFLLEGDGSALMSLGVLPQIAAEAPSNLVHVVLDNEAYESTGAQPSISSKVSLAQIAKASGYKSVTQVENRFQLESVLLEDPDRAGPQFILVKVAIAPIRDIPRISYTPTQIRDRFRNHMALLEPSLRC